MPYQLQSSTNPAGSSSIAFSADGLVMAVGHNGYTGTLSSQGGVRIYDKVSGVWTQRGGVMVAADAAASDYYGHAVALSADGNVLAVGAPMWEGGTADQGGVYIYDRNGSGWTQRGAVLVASDVSTGVWYGKALALSADGNTLVVASPDRNVGGSDRGGVYVYDRNGTAWTQRGAVLAAATHDYSYYGSGVSISADGNVLVIGESGYTGAINYQGGVHIYDRNGTGWTKRGSTLVATDNPTHYMYGSSVAISDDGSVLAVGDYQRDNASTSAYQGGVYVYDRNGTGWTLRDTITKAGSNGFGFGVDLIGNALLAIDDTDSSAGGGIHFFTIGRSPVYAGSLTFSRPENGTSVGTATFTDPDGDTLTYTLSGADASKFTITSAGALAFKTAPDFENPTDAG